MNIESYKGRPIPLPRSTFPPFPDREASHTEIASGPVMLKNVLILSLLIGATLCQQPHKRWDDFELKHEWVEGAPSGWEVLRGPAPSDERLTMRIGPNQHGLEDLIEHLHAVNDPSHRRYASPQGIPYGRYSLIVDHL